MAENDEMFEQELLDNSATSNQDNPDEGQPDDEATQEQSDEQVGEQESEQEPEEKPQEDLNEKYTAAVREMKAKQEEAAQLRKELAQMKAEIEKTKIKENEPNMANFSDDVKEQLEEKYGMPFNQIQAMYDVQNLIISEKLKPLEEVILSSQITNNLNKFVEETPIAKGFEDKIAEKLAEKPLVERAKASSIKSAWKEVLADNFNEVIEKVKEEVIKGKTAKPASQPSVNSSAKPEKSKAKPILSKEEREYLISKGQNPDEVEKFYQSEPVKKEYSDILEI